MFNDKHLGRAVALRREALGRDQIDLAHTIGVHKSTMNGYEKGSRGMDIATIVKISQALGCEPIEIWDDAFGIFRFNYFREQAEKMGVPIEELAAGIHSRPSAEQIQASFQTLSDQARQFLSLILPFLRADRAREGRLQIPTWGVVVPSETPEKRQRAIELQRGRKKKPTKRREPKGG